MKKTIIILGVLTLLTIIGCNKNVDHKMIENKDSTIVKDSAIYDSLVVSYKTDTIDLYENDSINNVKSN